MCVAVNCQCRFHGKQVWTENQVVEADTTSFIHLLSTGKQDVLACGFTAAACCSSCQLVNSGRGQESHLPQPQAPAEDVLPSQQHCFCCADAEG